MRYFLIAIAILLAASAAALVAASSGISAHLAKAEIAERLSIWTRRPVSLEGEPAVTVFPSPGVRIEDIIVSPEDDAKGPLSLATTSLQASVRVLPLLSGRLEVGSLTLINPRLHLSLDEAGFGGGEGKRGWSPAMLGAILARLADMRFDEVTLRDGIITCTNPRTGQTEAFRAVRLHVVWQRPAQEVALSGSFEWRDEKIDFSVELNAPSAAFGGKGSHGQLALASTPLSADDEDGYTGLRELAGESGFPGQSLREAFGWQDGRIAQGWSVESLLIDGKFHVDQTSIRFSDATFELDGNTTEGDLTLRLGDRPVLTGSLSFEDLDLSPYVRTLLPKRLSELLALPVSARWLTHADIDLDASAEEVDLGGVQFTDAAAKLAVRNGRMMLDLRQAGLGGGRVEGKMAVEPAREGVAMHLSGRLGDVSVGEIGSSLRARLAHRLIGYGQPPAGTASAVFDLAVNGSTVGALVESMAGTAAAEIRDGSIDGADMVLTLERLVSGNTVIAKGKAPFLPVAGRTYFTELTFRLAAGDGVARAEQIRIAGDRFEITLNGEGGLKRGEIMAVGVASLFAASSSGDGNDDSHPIVALPFGVGGTMRQPVVAPGIPRIARRADDASIHPPVFWERFAGNIQDR